MFKQAIVLMLSLSLAAGGVPLPAIAQGSEALPTASTDGELTLGEAGGYLVGNAATLRVLAQEKMFASPKGGHGFAAEAANNLSDRLAGKGAKIVGSDNVKDGPDRKITLRDGSSVYIQDKYYRTAAESVNAAFDENGRYRYYFNGKPQLLEVPSDQYEEAVRLMQSKIEEGKVPGVTDPARASELVRKGSVTYDQAVKISKPGNFESLKFDAKSGAVSTGLVFGVSFAIDFSLSCLAGDDPLVAAQQAASNACLTGGALFVSSVITEQIARTQLGNGVQRALAPSMGALQKSAVGKAALEALVKAAEGEAAGVSAKTIANSASRILSKTPVIGTVFTVIMSAPDAFDLFNGRISKEQFIKNVSGVLVGVVGTTVGAFAGTAIGSVIPGVGNMAGGVVGGLAGGVGGSLLGSFALDQVYAGDAEAMYEVLDEVYAQLAEEYLIVTAEGDAIAASLAERLDDNTLKDMYASEGRGRFADELLRPLFEEQVATRLFVENPTDAMVRSATLEALQGIVFIH